MSYKDDLRSEILQLENKLKKSHLEIQNLREILGKCNARNIYLGEDIERLTTEKELLKEKFQLLKELIDQGLDK